MAESAFPGFAEHTWFSFFAPAGTPPRLVKQLNADIAQALQAADARGRLDALSLEFAPHTPAQFAALVKAEVVKYAQVVKESGARAD